MAGEPSTAASADDSDTLVKRHAHNLLPVMEYSEKKLIADAIAGDAQTPGKPQFYAAGIFQAKRELTIFQGHAQGVKQFSKLWLPYDPRYFMPPGSAEIPMVRAEIPKGTLIAVGDLYYRIPSPTAPDAGAYWYIEDTQKGPGGRPPMRWKCRVVQPWER
jgi:hypothetical protein